MFKTAFSFILYDKPKSIGALAGAIISVFLIGQQSGIFIFLTDAMASFVINNPGYVWVVDEKTNNVNSLGILDMRLGREIASLPGVEKVYPVVIASGSAKFENGITSGVSLIGTEAPDFVGGPWNLSVGKKEDLLQEGAVLTEFFDKTSLGNAEIGDYFEINGRKVFIAGNTKGVRGFSAPTYTFMTIERARALAGLSPNKASLFLIKPASGMDPLLLVSSINQHIKGVRAWEEKAFAKSTVVEVLKTTGIALSIGSLIVFALISGLIIIGLTFYSAAIDRIRDYGTLKAIGATNGYIRRLILAQAFIISILGYGVGVMMIEGFRNGIANAGTIFTFPLWLKFGFLLITLFIAMTGSLFAIRRIARLEPATIFRM